MRSISRTEYKRRVQRKDSYHLVASRNRLPDNPEDEEEDMLFRYLMSVPEVSFRSSSSAKSLRQAKELFLRELGRSKGDVTDPSVNSALQQLLQLSKVARNDLAPSQHTHPKIDGVWIDISKPKFPDCLGMNARMDYEYTLGRMSFGKFRPTDLLCSIQGSFNPIHEIEEKDIKSHSSHIPNSIRRKSREQRPGFKMFSYE